MEQYEEIQLDFAQVQEILKGRTAFYRTLSSLYFQPLTDGEIEAMAASNLADFCEEEGLMAQGIHDMVLYLKRRNSGTRRELAVDYTMSFGGMGAINEENALPLRSLFMEHCEREMYAEGYREAFAAYKKSCIKKAEGVDYPEDHIAFMFQFVALLSERASENIAQANTTEALEDLQAARSFIEEQIISWFPTLSKRAEQFMTTKFYKGVLKMTQGYLEDDLETLDAIIATVQK